MLSLSDLSSCFSWFQKAQSFAWQRRTLPKERTHHLLGLPAEWCVCNSAASALLKEKYVVHDKGIVCFRGDTRSPDKIFKEGFSFSGSFNDFKRLYVCDGKGTPTTPACCLGSLALLTFAPHCFCGYAQTLLALQCGCMLCSYFRVSFSPCSPTKFCATNLTETPGTSSASILSLSKDKSAALRYPMGVITEQPGREGYLYACYLPAPYVDLDRYLTTTRPKGISSSLDDKEVFPLGAPVLPVSNIIGVWKLQADPSGDLEFLKQRSLVKNCHKIVPRSFQWNTKSSFFMNKNPVINPSLTPEEFDATYRNEINKLHSTK